jgi:hypothetical protein
MGDFSLYSEADNKLLQEHTFFIQPLYREAGNIYQGQHRQVALRLLTRASWPFGRIRFRTRQMLWHSECQQAMGHHHNICCLQTMGQGQAILMASSSNQLGSSGQDFHAADLPQLAAYDIV